MMAASRETICGKLGRNCPSYRNRARPSEAHFFRMKLMQLAAAVYAIPLSAGISLVYCASRFELPEKIVRSAVLMFAKTIAALVVLYLLLLYLSR